MLRIPTTESKKVPYSKNPELQTHIQLFIDEEGFITKTSINAVFEELQRFERKTEVDELIKAGKIQAAKELQSSPIENLKEGEKVLKGARYIFCIAGSRFFNSGGRMLPKDVIAMRHPNDTGFFQKNGVLNEESIQDFMNQDYYFKLDQATGDRVITRESFANFMRDDKASADKRWKNENPSCGRVLKKIGPQANTNELLKNSSATC